MNWGRIFFFLLVCVKLTTNISLYAQAPGWVWGRTTNENVISDGASVCVDNSGNSYVTGYFEASSITFGSTILFSKAPSYQSCYIAKYDPMGNVLWAQNAGVHSLNQAYSVTTDDSDNVYMLGIFNDTAIFGSYTILASSNYPEVFLVKYNSLGSVVWARNIGGVNTYNFPRSVTADISGNTYITGEWGSSPTVTFGSITLNSADGGFDQDIFVIKCDPSGTVIWGRSYGSGDGSSGISVATDLTGNLFVTGYFISDPYIIESATLHSSGGSPFIAKYDPSGNFLWARSSGSSAYNSLANSVAVDPLGNAYITGYFACPSISFGVTVLNNADANGADPDIFLAKYSPSGQVLWAKSMGDSAADDEGTGVYIDASSNVYITGFFTSATIQFGSTVLTNNGPLFSSDYGPKDIFLAKYSQSGNVLWAQYATPAQLEDLSNSVACDGSGNCYIAGSFDCLMLDFGPSTLAATTQQQMFVARTGSDVGISTLLVSHNGISVYPNPSDGVFHLQIPSDIFGVSDEKVKIEITDVLGKIIYESEAYISASGYQRDIDLSLSPKGIYFYRIYDSRGILDSGKLSID